MGKGAQRQSSVRLGRGSGSGPQTVVEGRGRVAEGRGKVAERSRRGRGRSRKGRGGSRGGRGRSREGRGTVAGRSREGQGLWGRSRGAGLSMSAVASLREQIFVVWRRRGCKRRYRDNQSCTSYDRAMVAPQPRDIDLCSPAGGQDAVQVQVRSHASDF